MLSRVMRISQVQRPTHLKLCLPNNTKTAEVYSIKLNDRHTEKVCCAYKLDSHVQGRGYTGSKTYVMKTSGVSVITPNF